MFSVVVVILVCLLFSFFFSGMEIAFVSSNKLKLEIEKRQNKTLDRIVGVFLRNQGQYITTILVGNNIALVIYSMSMSTLIHFIAAQWGVSFNQGAVIIETIISTIVIIFVGEFIPKALFGNNPNFFMRIFAVPIYLIYLILYPVAVFSTWLSIILLRIFGVKVKPENGHRGFARVDLTHLLDETREGEQENAEEENEIKIFRNALDFSDIRVRDCMVPRPEVEAVEITDTVEELTARFLDTNYSRIFVYEGSIDNIIGYASAKNLFKRPATIREIMMDVDYVPESLPAQKLLSMFIRKNRSVAVVIDEIGGTAGIVSMEDVLEEIFGEIEDEHDEQDMVEKQTAEGIYVFSCRLEVDYLNEKYNLHIPESDEYDTLAGYIIYNNEGIPARGEQLTIDDKRITILRADASKLELARVEVVKEEK